MLCFIMSINSRDPTIPQDIQEEKGIKFVYEVYEKR